VQVQSERPLRLHDFGPERAQLREEVLAGLQKSQKELPCKLLYDERGSRLFGQICELEEYYPTRTEMAIMRAYAPEMASLLGRGCLLIEYGSGGSTKTRILLDQLPDLAGYVPIDISRGELARSAAALVSDYPSLEVLPVCADYTEPIDLPTPSRPVARRVAYFPGSTIGNFDPEPARHFLRTVAAECGPAGALLIGVDLRKDPWVLHRAYNDQKGVSAQFNLNVLARINRELDGDFRLDQFQHYAFYNPLPSRVEMHLVSLADQQAMVGEVAIHLRRGESIWTESSYKYSPEEFESLAAETGWGVEKIWTDPRVRSADRLPRSAQRLPPRRH
jgi:dimethylhistidine N-methyltransferase